MAVNHVDDPTLGEFDDIHAACDYAAYNSMESGGESGYATHSDSSNSPPITPEENISHPTFPTETFATSGMESSQEMKPLSYNERQVEKYSLCIYEVIYNQKQVNQVASNTEEIEIIQAGKELHDLIETDLASKMNSFKEQIKRDGVALSPNMRQFYLRESFKQLMKKVAKEASWRNYGHILLCLGLIRNVAEELEVVENPQFQSDIKGDYSKFVRENFSDFISSMGGFSDIADYISHVKSGPINFFNVAAVAVGGLAAGLMWVAKKVIVTKSSRIQAHLLAKLKLCRSVWSFRVGIHGFALVHYSTSIYC